MMSTPEPIYEMPWMKSDGFFFRNSDASMLSICVHELQQRFSIVDARTIKIALFDKRCTEAVKISPNTTGRMEFREFCFDGEPECLTCGVCSLIRQLMEKRDTKTLYAKCYIEA